ncbi:hypothetical protein KFZ58_01665 [Virgibacillus sp. NKC19-16]|uniref:hypothetical protein n=1 Tax=Virgibacillus salidurans TaxID=2831673 RepID=UPI001F3F8935|nr:hypothetical protein [Virgibacillus sp. NKC19-16]UJL46692.1 hypothetical protein KFZ58_01665 [Virgibacillus sp. NKC19-16]
MTLALILAIISLAGFIILRSAKLFFIQLLLVISIFATELAGINVLPTALGIIQILLGAFFIFKFIKAIDRNYQLVLEKTHQIPSELTSRGANGTQSSFI